MAAMRAGDERTRAAERKKAGDKTRSKAGGSARGETGGIGAGQHMFTGSDGDDSEDETDDGSPRIRRKPSQRAGSLSAALDQDHWEDKNGDGGGGNGHGSSGIGGGGGGDGGSGGGGGNGGGELDDDHSISLLPARSDLRRCFTVMYFYKAAAMYKIGDLGGAAEAFIESIRLDPAEKKAQNSLVFVLREMQQKLMYGALTVFIDNIDQSVTTAASAATAAVAAAAAAAADVRGRLDADAAAARARLQVRKEERRRKRITGGVGEEQLAEMEEATREDTLETGERKGESEIGEEDKGGDEAKPGPASFLLNAPPPTIRDVPQLPQLLRAEVEVIRGILLQSKEQPAAALRSFEVAVRLAPDLCQGHIGRADCKLMLDDYTGALDAAADALRVAPSPKARENIVRLQCRALALQTFTCAGEERYAEAIASYEEYQKLAQHIPPIPTPTSTVSSASGEEKEPTLHSRGAGKAGAGAQVGSGAGSQGDIDEYFSVEVQAQLRYMVAVCHYHDGRPEETTTALLREATALDPTMYDAFRALGLVLYESGSLVAARDAYIRAVALSGASSSASSSSSLASASSFGASASTSVVNEPNTEAVERKKETERETETKRAEEGADEDAASHNGVLHGYETTVEVPPPPTLLPGTTSNGSSRSDELRVSSMETAHHKTLYCLGLVYLDLDQPREALNQFDDALRRARGYVWERHVNLCKKKQRRKETEKRREMTCRTEHSMCVYVK